MTETRPESNGIVHRTNAGKVLLRLVGARRSRVSDCYARLLIVSDEDRFVGIVGNVNARYLVAVRCVKALPHQLAGTVRLLELDDGTFARLLYKTTALVNCSRAKS